jgi:hypothetical protein
MQGWEFIINDIKASGLRGRGTESSALHPCIIQRRANPPFSPSPVLAGGAGFPSGLKYSFMPKNKPDGRSSTRSMHTRAPRILRGRLRRRAVTPGRAQAFVPGDQRGRERAVHVQGPRDPPQRAPQACPSPTQPSPPRPSPTPHGTSVRITAPPSYFYPHTHLPAITRGPRTPSSPSSLRHHAFRHAPRPPLATAPPQLKSSSRWLTPPPTTHPTPSDPRRLVPPRPVRRGPAAPRGRWRARSSWARR